MKQNFREFHLLKFLEFYDDKENLPLDLAAQKYFRNNRACGSKDRRYILDTVYDLVRWRLLLDAHIRINCSWEKRYNLFLSSDIAQLQEESSLSDYQRYSFPEEIFTLLVDGLGREKAIDVAETTNTRAPLTTRVNTIKADYESVFNKLSASYNISRCALAENGIVWNERINFNELQFFKEGFFEVQDEGSQLLASLVNVLPGQHFCDYCSGSGGKSLAIAPAMQGKGQIYLHDIREPVLREARKRLKKAGVQNCQIVPFKDKKLKKMRSHMDWVLVDAPCSGTGTLRRNPDMKWRLNKDSINELVDLQREVFQGAISLVKSGGHIVYATCSVLAEENQRQRDYFMLKHPYLEVVEELATIPQKNGMDGFYGVVFKVAE